MRMPPEILPSNPATGRRAAANERARVGATLRVVRELRGASVKQMADAMGVSGSYLTNIEGGFRRLTPLMLARAAQFLDVPQLALVHPESAEQEDVA